MSFYEFAKKEIMPVIPDNHRGGDRIVFLDVIKIISAFLVVFYHISFYSLDYGFAAGTPYVPNLNRIVMSIAACSVPLFFLVNGALMLSKRRPWRSVYYKAAKALALIMLCHFLSFPDWFFKTLIILYLFYPLISYLWEEKRWYYYVLLALLFIFPFLYNQCVVLSKLFYNHSLRVTGAKTMYSILYFCLGNVLIRRKAVPLWQSMLLSLLGLIVLLMDCVILTNAYQVMSDGVNPAFPTIGALLLSTGIFECLKYIRIEKEHLLLKFFSEGILSIYLFHIAVYGIWRPMFGAPTNLIGALLGTIFTCTICSILGMVLKRIPVLCFFTRL